MYRKTVTIMLIIIFAMATTHCASTTITQKFYGESDAQKMKAGAVESKKIVAVAHVSGKWVHFTSPKGGKLIGNTMAGEAMDAQGKIQQVTIPLSKIVAVEMKVFSSKNVLKILVGLATPAIAFFALLVGFFRAGGDIM